MEYILRIAVNFNEIEREARRKHVINLGLK